MCLNGGFKAFHNQSETNGFRGECFPFKLAASRYPNTYHNVHTSFRVRIWAAENTIVRKPSTPAHRLESYSNNSKNPSPILEPIFRLFCTRNGAIVLALFFLRSQKLIYTLVQVVYRLSCTRLTPLSLTKRKIKFSDQLLSQYNPKICCIHTHPAHTCTHNLWPIIACPHPLNTAKQNLAKAVSAWCVRSQTLCVASSLVHLNVQHLLGRVFAA